MKLNLPFIPRSQSPMRTVLGMMFAPQMVGRLGMVLVPLLLRTLTRGKFKTGPKRSGIRMSLLSHLLRRRRM